MNLRLLALFRYAFVLSVLVFFYGTLFPFDFDFSALSLSEVWSEMGRIPYWDATRGRIHSLPDMLANALLTFPMGFFGFMWLLAKGKRPPIALWFALAFASGLLIEILQLGLRFRTSDITDPFNNGLGAFFGACAAALFGRQIFHLISEAFKEKKEAFFWILAGVIAVEMLLPLVFTLDVSHIRSSIKQLWFNPWESGVPIENEWILMVEFAILGALTGAKAHPRLAAMAIFLPFALEGAQIIVVFHVPSLRDLAMNAAGVFAGIAAARYKPALIRPVAGFLLMSLALIAQGLSPYGFSAPSHFEWIPLVEYYNRTTGAALYDAMAGLLRYGLMTALLPRRKTVLWAVLLAAGIELAQVFTPGRFAGISDILIAGIGAWAGYALARAAADRIKPFDT